MSDELTSNPVLSDKHPDDVRDVGVDWSKKLPSGVTVVSATLFSVEPDDATLTVSAPSVVGSRTLSRTEDGTDGVDYTIGHKSIWSDGQERVEFVILPVRAS